MAGIALDIGGDADIVITYFAKELGKLLSWIPAAFQPMSVLEDNLPGIHSGGTVWDTLTHLK